VQVGHHDDVSQNIYTTLVIIMPVNFPFTSIFFYNPTIQHTVTCYEAEGGVIELPETGAPYAPHVKAKIT